jgi:MFS transporter, putative metabolite:H+ symporter
VPKNTAPKIDAADFAAAAPLAVSRTAGGDNARATGAQKKLTANQWKLIATANLADLLDFFDFFLIGYVLAFITKEWQLTYWQGAVILLSSGIGAVPGAFFWGWVADKIGRRKVFIATALNVALATGIMYFTPGQDG